MRILHVIHTPRYSGAEMLVAALTKIHTQMGHSTCVVALHPAEEDFMSVIDQQKKLGIYWVQPSKALNKLKKVSIVKQAVSHFSPDITFAHSVIPAAYARLGFAPKVISVLHDASENDYKSLYFKAVEKLLQFRTAGVVAVSELARQKYVRQFRYPRTEHIPNGIDCSAYISTSAQRQPTKHSLALDNDSFVAIQIGRINSIKQQHLSLKAIAPVIQKNANVHLVLVGIIEDERYLDKLKQFTIEKNIKSNVHFLGPRNDVSNLLAMADLYLMPSLREAHSVAMIEALASGIPIIASLIPSFSYTMKFDGVQLLVPEEIDVFSTVIQNYTNQKIRYQRELSGLDIKDTAIAYIKFGKQCMS